MASEAVSEFSTFLQELFSSATSTAYPNSFSDATAAPAICEIRKGGAEHAERQIAIFRPKLSKENEEHQLLLLVSLLRREEGESKWTFWETEVDAETMSRHRDQLGISCSLQIFISLFRKSLASPHEYFSIKEDTSKEEHPSVLLSVKYTFQEGFSRSGHFRLSLVSSGLEEAVAALILSLAHTVAHGLVSASIRPGMTRQLTRTDSLARKSGFGASLPSTASDPADILSSQLLSQAQNGTTTSNSATAAPVPPKKKPKRMGVHLTRNPVKKGRGGKAAGLQFANASDDGEDD